VHGALEAYVQQSIMLGAMPATLKMLLDFYDMSYMTTFGTSELVGEDYQDGRDMLTAWHKRTDFSTRVVMSVEVKENFLVPTPIGEIPFNFILDRQDDMSGGKGEIVKVVDYKTNRWGWSPEDLRRLIQARAYGLAMQIKYLNAKEIWVEMDMLRHDGPVGTRFTREDNIATWKHIKAEAKRIVETPDTDTDGNPIALPERLNKECNFCVRKLSCGTLKRNIAVGGIGSFPDAQAAVNVRAQLDAQLKGIKAAIEEIDGLILSEARATDATSFSTDEFTLKLATKRMRRVDPDMAARVLGPRRMQKYGSSAITMKNIDHLLKSDELDAEEKKALRSLITTVEGQPYLKVEAADPFAAPPAP